MDFLDQEKYVKAQEEFQFILSRGTGTDYGDDAQFFLAESYFLNEQYLLSIQEYEINYSVFPNPADNHINVDGSFCSCQSTSHS